jgi:hypothetical protein
MVKGKEVREDAELHLYKTFKHIDLKVTIKNKACYPSF